LDVFADNLQYFMISRSTGGISPFQSTFSAKNVALFAKKKNLFAKKGVLFTKRASLFAKSPHLFAKPAF
jgi:hypothetical protein